MNTILFTLLGATTTVAEWPGPIKSDIDSIGKGTPDKPRFADNIPVYPGSRCGENFGLRPPPATHGLNTDAMLCVGRPKNDAKEQDGDSGGPVFTMVNGVRVQIGVNTGSYPADEFRSSGTAAGNPGNTHIGYYTRVDWPTIKPWLTKILAGDFVGAKAMTCAGLGGKTSPNPNPGNRRLSKIKTNVVKVKTKTKTKKIRRRDLISGDGASTATDGQFPSLATMGNYYDSGGSKVWEPGCDGSLIKSNVYLAAAHCFTSTEMKTDRNQMRVWPGAWNLADPEPSASKFRFATEIIRHPCYTMPVNYPACLESQPNCNDDSKPMEDIAVAILTSDVSSGTAVTPLLGQGTYASTTLTFPVMGTIAGWGRYCDPDADSDPSKCTMKDWDVPLDPSKGGNDNDGGGDDGGGNSGGGGDSGGGGGDDSDDSKKSKSLKSPSSSTTKDSGDSGGDSDDDSDDSNKSKSPSSSTTKDGATTATSGGFQIKLEHSLVVHVVLLCCFLYVVHLL